jgi:hypothetical protein
MSRRSAPSRGAALAIVTREEPTDLDTLAAYAEGYAECAMKNIGRAQPPVWRSLP